jgi:hypothetical protein
VTCGTIEILLTGAHSVIQSAKRDHLRPLKQHSPKMAYTILQAFATGGTIEILLTGAHSVLQGTKKD